MQRKLIIRLRRSTTLLCHLELEGAFSAGTKGVSIAAGSAQHLSFFLKTIVEDQLLFALPYFAQLKFLLLTALINVFLLTFCSRKTCYKSFAIPIACTGYDGCPSHHRSPQAKLIFPLDLARKHQLLFSSRTPWNSHTLFFLSLFRLFSQKKKLS